MTQCEYGYDPAYVKLKAVKEDADSLGLPVSITKGLQSVIDLYQKRERFCVKMTTEPSEVVKGIVEDTLNHPWEKVFNEGKTKWNINVNMLSGHLEGSFLKFLISSSRAKRVLEIGMFTGCATLGMAEVLPENGEVFACELDPYLIKLARRLMDKSPHGKKVKIIEGLALDNMKDFAKKGEKFDFIFVDAVKKEYIDYLMICIDNLLASGGTIAVDNALYFGSPYAGKPDEPLAMFNEWILTRNDICHVLLPIRDGIMLIRRKEDMVAVNNQ